MATILNDGELKKLIGTVIVGGQEASIRPNSYVLRLGAEGEFLSAGKPFTLGKAKKGIRISAGHSVAVTALETIDFRAETVEPIYPGCALHAIISPTTDLSREGIVAPTTQVDAGYHGTLNWTITNTSSEERRYLHGENLYRLTILKLEGGEVPLVLYSGAYQDRTGYVRSQRKGPPVGMRDSEWADSLVEGGPEELLETLMKSGFPWHTLGQKLKAIDQELKIVTDEYGEIHDSLENLEREMGILSSKHSQTTASIPQVIGSLEKLEREMVILSSKHSETTASIPQIISDTLKVEATALQNRWLLALGSLLVGLVGLVLSFTANQSALDFVKGNGAWIGIVLVIVGVVSFLAVNRRTPPRAPPIDKQS